MAADRTRIAESRQVPFLPFWLFACGDFIGVGVMDMRMFALEIGYLHAKAPMTVEYIVVPAKTPQRRRRNGLQLKLLA